jgi:hypothetical protein
MILLWHTLLYLWAAPASFVGLLPLPVLLAQGGTVKLVGGVLEAQGGIVTRLLRRGLPWVGPGAAITFGHVVWGCDQSCLDQSRDHERVHVRQYERWGPLFIPLYLLASLVAACRGLDPYRDNPFEREAYDAAD